MIWVMNARSGILSSALAQSGVSQSALARMSGVRQPSISQFLAGRINMSDHQLDRLLSCLGFRLEVVQQAVPAGLKRSKERSWLLHRAIASALTEERLRMHRRELLTNVATVRARVQGQPHLANLDRWEHLIRDSDLQGLRRVLTGVDEDAVQMREVTPMTGLLSQSERIAALRGRV